MEIVAVPMLKDNLGYLVRCCVTRQVFFVDISHSSVEKFFQVLEENDALSENLVVLTTHKVHCRSCVYLINFHSTPIIQEGTSKQVVSFMKDLVPL
jgi:hypothetical protein